MDGNMANKRKTTPGKSGAVGYGSVRSARVVKVIEMKASAGSGTAEDPKRIITEYWSADGRLLAVNDPEILPFPD